MNHGYDDDEDEFDPPPQVRAGPSGGLLAQLMGGMGGMGGMAGGMMGMGYGGYGMSAPASAYDDYFKAYSVAVMGGNERPELMYGGKIIMPPSALAKLSALDIQSPWTFHLTNPKNSKRYHSYAGVLEFIAPEGVVYLPAWMMRSMKLTEGDPVRLTGAVAPKGKLVKLQAQSTAFLQVSDPRAVLESALRYHSVLTKDTIIEISYNSLTFEFLIVDVNPSSDPNGGISVIDTDLEVDFDVPVGYVEPPRPEPVAIPTMADKLKIDLGGTDVHSAGSSRPASSLGGSGTGVAGGSGENTPKESFTGIGQSLSGRRIKGKGLAKKIEEVDSNSRIIRNDKPRIFTPESLNDADRKIPAALKLPAGKFFFGYKYIPFDPSKAPKKPLTDIETPGSPQAFVGHGNTLSGKRKAPTSGAATPDISGATNGHTDIKGKGKEVKEEEEEKKDPWAGLGSGNTLRKTSNPVSSVATSGALGKRKEGKVKSPKNEVIDATMLDEDDFWEAEADDEDAYIEVDSD